jgi:hypothetical protein
VAKFWPLLFWAPWYKMKMYADFLKKLGRQGIRRAFCEAKEHKI